MKAWLFVALLALIKNAASYCTEPTVIWEVPPYANTYTAASLTDSYPRCDRISPTPNYWLAHDGFSAGTPGFIIDLCEQKQIQGVRLINSDSENINDR